MGADDTKANLEGALAAPTADDTGAPRAAVAEQTREEGPDESPLVLWYQPKIDIKQRCLAGAEALVRVREPATGELLPAGVVPPMDDADIARLTEQALVATLRDWSVFDAAGLNLHLSINVAVNLLDRADRRYRRRAPPQGRALAGPDRRGRRGPDRARHPPQHRD